MLLIVIIVAWLLAATAIAFVVGGAIALRDRKECHR